MGRRPLVGPRCGSRPGGDRLDGQHQPTTWAGRLRPGVHPRCCASAAGLAGDRDLPAGDRTTDAFEKQRANLEVQAPRRAPSRLSAAVQWAAGPNDLARAPPRCPLLWLETATPRWRLTPRTCCLGVLWSSGPFDRASFHGQLVPPPPTPPPDLLRRHRPSRHRPPRARHCASARSSTRCCASSPIMGIAGTARSPACISRVPSRARRPTRKLEAAGPRRSAQLAPWSETALHGGNPNWGAHRAGGVGGVSNEFPTPPRRRPRRPTSAYRRLAGPARPQGRPRFPHDRRVCRGAVQPHESSTRSPCPARARTEVVLPSRPSSPTSTCESHAEFTRHEEKPMRGT